MPGGISDTPLIAMDMGADVSVVTVLQFIRVLFGLGCLPWIIVFVDKTTEKTNKTASEEEHITVNVQKTEKKKASFLSFLPILCLSTLFGYTGYREAMLCITPAGTVETAFIAADLGDNSPSLALIQMFRIIGVMLVFPQIFTLITILNGSALCAEPFNIVISI